VAFFVGGGVFLVYMKLKNFNLKPLCLITGIVVLLSWIITFLNLKFDSFLVYPSYVGRMYSVYFLFPLTILFLALFETYRGSLGARIRFIGDFSYSSYLIHFPLQIIFILGVRFANLKRDFFYSGLSVFLFFSILLFLSWISFNRFERPLQSWMRKRFITGKRA
jgi:peptidoglycan/LPS O-acetylase OafA/YrhL